MTLLSTTQALRLAGEDDLHAEVVERILRRREERARYRASHRTALALAARSRRQRIARLPEDLREVLIPLLSSRDPVDRAEMERWV